MTNSSQPARRKITRRTLLKGAGVLTGGVLAEHAINNRSAAALLNTLAGQAAPLRREDSPPARVALAQADSYDKALIRERVTAMIDQLGGLDDVVRSGDRVAIKTNLTGGAWADAVLGKSSTEVHITHPAVTRALVEAVLDAGAKEVFIVEAVYDQESWSAWGNTALAREYEQVTLVNLNDPRPYDDFVSVPVGENWLVYDSLLMHPLLTEVDVVMSVAKMKCHATAGITLGMKNMFGVVPMHAYRMSDSDTHRSALHGPGNQGMIRVPSVIMDIVRARPIDFVLIDGVKTAEGSEGPWNEDFNQKIAKVLVAGKGMVETDAVAAAVMGFDPAAPSFVQAPFRYCLNHLQLAEALGLGTIALDQIEVVGATIEEVQTRFRPYRATAADMRVQRPDFPVPYPQAYGKV